MSMVCTAIPSIRGVWSVHREGQASATGTGVYYYERGNWWSCEVHKAWRPWLPGQGVPCQEIILALELRTKEKP